MKFLSTDSGTNASVIGWDSCAFDALQVGQWQPIAVDAKHQSSLKSLRKRLLDDTVLNIFRWKPGTMATSLFSIIILNIH